eukprot:scaffold10203_cov272-Chaetoceros_neogracile.AAC.15
MAITQYLLVSAVCAFVSSTEAFAPSSHMLVSNKKAGTPHPAGISSHFLLNFGSCRSSTLHLQVSESSSSSLPQESSPQAEEETRKISDDFERFQQRQMLKLSLLFQAQETKRGFQAIPSQRDEISTIISQLAALNPTSQPAAAYYPGQNNLEEHQDISGKWTLQYTDAPDITSLDPTLGNDANLNNGITIPSPPPLSKLGRIGQECDAVAGTIVNVIEWKQPDFIDWFDKVNKSDDSDSPSDDGTSGPRVLQKVVCEATADPARPKQVDLQLVGFELVGETEDRGNRQSSESEDNGDGSGSGTRDFNPFNPFGLPLPFSSLEDLKDGPARLLKNNPVKLRGPLKAPFGKFEILYLDEDMRIIKTGQGYYAVNIRGEVWF